MRVNNWSNLLVVVKPATVVRWHRLERLVNEYLDYYNVGRGHAILDGDSPAGRSVQSRPSVTANVVALSRVRGVHHRYEWREAA